jgi:DNA polymerase delta subunit 1
MFGLTKEGNSILVHIFGFVSYFYIESPKDFKINNDNLAKLKNELNERGKKNPTIKGRNSVVKIEPVYKESLKFFKGYGDNNKKPYLKIYTTQPSFVASLRTIFEKGFVMD